MSLGSCHSLPSCPVKGGNRQRQGVHHGCPLEPLLMEAFVPLSGGVGGLRSRPSPALLPSAQPTRRWPHVVMALGMAAGHLGGLFLPSSPPGALSRRHSPLGTRMEAVRWPRWPWSSGWPGPAPGSSAFCPSGAGIEGRSARICVRPEWRPAWPSWPR